jgi:hypothetical protein
LTVGDFLNLEDTGGVLITSDTFTQTGLAGPAVDTYAETDGDTTVASGTFTISSCAVSTPTPTPTPPPTPPSTPPSVPGTGADVPLLLAGMLGAAGAGAIVLAGRRRKTNI